MSLSHFDEKSGIVACTTPWGRWWQTVTEVFIDVDVPEGTRAKECKVVIKTRHIEVKVKNEVIFQGELFSNVVVNDCTWTLEEQKKISILLAKVEKFTSDNLWESLLSDDYAPDAWTREEMLKKLDLEKFQMENGSGEGDSIIMEKDDESVGSKSDNEEEENEESQEQAVDRSSEVSSPPQSPGSADAAHSEDEVHISENEDSNHGSDNEENKNERDSEASDVESENENEEDKEEKGGNDSDHEVPEINIQSEEEDNEDKADSDVEADAANKQSDDENEPDEDNMELSAETENVEEPADKVSHLADSDDEDEDKMQVETIKEAEDNPDSDGEVGPKKKKVGDLIANIFGDSDEEGGRDGEGTVIRKKKKMKKLHVASDSEDEGEKSDAEEEIEHDSEKKDDEEEQEPQSEPEADKEADDEVQESDKKPEESSTKKKKQAVSDDDSDDGINKMREDYVSDFDLMMQKKKENSRRRKRRDVDIINDSDDLIADIIAQMRQAADEDRALNSMKKTATKKLKILPLVMSQLKKQDLKTAFLDQGVLNVMADWLAPLPDRSLPNLQIREGMIKRLNEFPPIDQSLLKSSGVGRALMYLYKHPKETKENKERAGRIITEWARPIFNVATNYHSLTKEEREQRDYEHIPKKRKTKDQPEDTDSQEEKNIEKALDAGDKKLRPGDKGWIGRARVPAPSTKDYVYRPKWNVEMECGRGPTKKSATRLEKHMRSIQEKKRLSKCQRAVTISIEGRKMAI